MVASRSKRAEVAARRTRLIQHRLDGRRYEDIYEELGYASRSAASRDFNRALEGNIAEARASMEVYREAELMRLDQLTITAMRVLTTRHYAVTASGKVARHPDTDDVLEDDGPTLAAIDRLLKIQDRRAKLLGLDAPQKLEVLTIDAIDAAIADLNTQLAAAVGEAGALDGTAATES